MQYRIEKIGIHILAFLTARCGLLGMYPFVVPFFMAAYLQERSSISLFVVLLAGILSTLEWVEAVRYALVIGLVLVLLGRTDRKKMFEDPVQIALAAAVILWAVSLPFEYIVTRKELCLLYTFMEAVIAFCFALIYEQGFAAMRVGTNRMFANNERFIGVFALWVTALFGCPVMKEPLNLLFFLCGLLLLYCGCRFEGSVGVAVGGITGLVLAFQMGKVSYLAVMLLLSVLIVLLRELGKPGVMLSYLAGVLLLGVVYEKTLLTPPMLFAGLAVIGAFFLIPSGWMKRICTVKAGRSSITQDVLLQEITRERINGFGQAFVDMERMLMAEEADRSVEIPNGLSNMYLSGDGISLLNAVESQSNRLAEMRKNFIRQLGQIGETIRTFQTELAENAFRAEAAEERITERFARLGVCVTRALPVQEPDDRIRIYVRCHLAKEKVVTGDMLAKRLGHMFGRRFVCLNRGEDMVTGQEECFQFVEEGNIMLTTGIVRRNREGETSCGDNFSVIKLDAQKAVLMLSDGMGSGEQACDKSSRIVELLEQLLAAGFCRELAIELMNSFISFLADGSVSSTLDLTMIDLYTGMADFIKLGASTTFIRRKDKVECIRSTSLPMGVLEQVEFDTCARKLYHGDVLVMVSDGVLDGIIFENKEAYLADLIGAIDSTNAQVIAQTILEDVETMQRNGLRDDSTILVTAVWERGKGY